MKTQKAVAAFLAAKNYSSRTLEQYHRSLDYLVKVCPEFPGGPGDLRDALADLESVWVRLSTWIVWRVFFRWCAEEYALENPMGRVERPKVPKVEMRALELNELTRLWGAAETIQEKCIIALALDSGIRASEFGRLRVSDVGKDTIRVCGKGNKQLSVPLSLESRQILQVLIEQDGGDPGAYLFRGRGVKPITRWGVYSIVRRCMDRAGIAGSKLGPHLLRHSLGKYHIASGGDSFTLQRIMRHSDIETTRRYVNLSIEDVIRAHHGHSPLKGILSDMKFEDLDPVASPDPDIPQGIMELSPERPEPPIGQPVASTLQKVRDALDELATQIPLQDDLNGSSELLGKLIRAHNHMIIGYGHLLELLSFQLEDLSLISFSHSHDAAGKVALSDKQVDYFKYEEKFLKGLIQEADAKLAKYREKPRG